MKHEETTGAVAPPFEQGVGRLVPERAIAALLHWWRLLTEPEGGEIVTMQPRRWHVRYTEGGVSIGMAYRTACNYAEVFGGKVERHEPPNVEANLHFAAGQFWVGIKWKPKLDRRKVSG